MPSLFSVSAKSTLSLPKGQTFVPSLFHLLWKKSDATLEGCEMKIPNTIIFHSGYVSSWYFTSKNGHIKKKNKEKLNRKDIIDGFPKKATRSSSEIVAYFLRPKGEEFEDAEVEYFDQASFENFIEHAMSKVDEDLYGLLQEFIEPDLEHNSVTKAVWVSGKGGEVRVETRTNINRITAASKQKLERVATFDGPEYLSKGRVWAAQPIIRKVTSLCTRMVDHIMEVEKEREFDAIKTMEAYFKISDGKIYFLFASSMHLTRKKMKAMIDPPLYRADTSSSFYFRLICDRAAGQIGGGTGRESHISSTSAATTARPRLSNLHSRTTAVSGKEGERW
eukprot:CAMPEP_0113881016 /NCGR_PEP_ID=MMETSP0780_2-20120614/8124_1 /TAXON_ID=652834 /ORGANISM="Palpitomonas bilix" /LENGTH=334 /DNA_ID=CAMNT_0000867791 /DNA_START=563 /DNA_END=1564 /DNA_ORIENTATION=- /assembly_acc=CAM_ASM_000599